MLEILYDQQLNCDNEAGLEIEEMSGMEKTQLKLPKETPFVMRPEEDENIPKEFLGSRRCRSLANITFVNESRPNLSSNIRASTHLGIRVKLFGLENLFEFYYSPQKHIFEHAFKSISKSSLEKVSSIGASAIDF